MTRWTSNEGFLTGGTGAIGRHLVPKLVAEGHKVTALVRSAEKAAQVERQGAVPAEVSLFDADGLATAFEGHDAVINLATAIPSTSRYFLPGAWKSNFRIRTEGSAAVAKAARSAGVGRLLQESVVFVYPDSGDKWIDESAELDVVPSSEPNVAAEENARRFAEQGGVGVVLRFGYFYGPGGAIHTEEILKFARLRFAMQLGGRNAYQAAIHLEDAASAVVAALEIPSGTYNVCDDEPLTAREFTDAMIAAVGRRPLLRGPGRLLALGGNKTAALTRSQRVSNQRFKDAANWSPHYPSAREGWAATVAAG